MSEVEHSLYHAMFDPWAEARRVPGLEVKVTRLPAFLQGCTEGRVIYLDDRLTEREKRCALTHELVHCYQHTAPPDPRDSNIPHPPGGLIEGIADFAIAPGQSHNVAVFVPERKVSVLIIFLN